MRNIRHIYLIVLLVYCSSCIVQFIPEIDEDKDVLVVEGLITDLAGVNTVKLSRSQPLGKKYTPTPVKGYIVKISDDLGNTYTLRESSAGTYVTNAATFRGVIGRKYTLHINNNASYNNLNFESFPMELRSVPPIDSLFYEKEVIKPADEYGQANEGCQVYLSTHDPSNTCRFYRWEFSETWEFKLPFPVINYRCWLSSNSLSINVKSTSVLINDKIDKFPINFISNETDRLKVQYSILVNQYSLNEDEYWYWQKLETFTEDVGGLYDITPASITGNIWCVENPDEKVLGYFSVSATTSKRLFIKEYFSGVIDLYRECITDTIPGNVLIPNLGTGTWILMTVGNSMPQDNVITTIQGCADCTIRGTNVRPDFWPKGK
jgi:hypothetical protein